MTQFCSRCLIKVFVILSFQFSKSIGNCDVVYYCQFGSLYIIVNLARALYIIVYHCILLSIWFVNLARALYIIVNLDHCVLYC